MLEVEDLHVHYGAIHALHGVSLTVERGQIVTLIGANGAGKSTTLRTISGLIRPSSGSISFEGKSITKVPPHEIVRLGIAQAPEGRGIFANLTVDENLDMGAFARRDRAEIAKDRERALELFPRLRERISQNAGTLSGGEQQMLALARALVPKPKLLMLDEPSLGLSPDLVATVFQRVVEIRRETGVSILIVEQKVREVLEICTRVYSMKLGRVAFAGQPEELKADKSKLRDLFL